MAIIGDIQRSERTGTETRGKEKYRAYITAFERRDAGEQ
jgi:hypothetical protein